MLGVYPRLLAAVICIASSTQVDPRRTPVVEVYQRTRDAVVSIYGQRVVTTAIWPDWMDPFGWGPVAREVRRVLGSGMIVHHEGFIVTNAHVVDKASQVTVVLADGRELAARIVGAATDKDLAILKVDSPNDLPTVELGTSSDLMIGETVIAIGNPYGYSNTLTSGVISALGRDIQIDQDQWLRGLIQTDAPINPGNSGGPLFNILGQVIGINTAVRSQAENIGFAIPVDTLVGSLGPMLMPEGLRRVRLGLVVGPSGSGKAVIVRSVTADSPAERQGIRPGDLIVSMDGNDVTSVVDFYVRLMHKQPGNAILIGIRRPPGPGIRTAMLKLEPRPLPDGAALARQWFGMSVSVLTERLARRFGYDRAYPIIIVTEVRPGGQADRVGLQPGDLIVRVNGSPVRDMNEFTIELEKVSDRPVQFEIMRITESIFGLIQRRFLIEISPAQKEPGPL